MSEDVFKLDMRAHPHAARSLVEASGIDIYTTYRNVGLELINGVARKIQLERPCPNCLGL